MNREEQIAELQEQRHNLRKESEAKRDAINSRITFLSTAIKSGDKLASVETGATLLITSIDEDSCTFKGVYTGSINDVCLEWVISGGAHEA